MSAKDMNWRGRAKCKGLDTNLFYPERGVSAYAAKTICGGCPVQAACLNYALTAREHIGIWGGTSERDRKKLRQRREPLSRVNMTTRKRAS